MYTFDEVIETSEVVSLPINRGFILQCGTIINIGDISKNHIAHCKYFEVRTTNNKYKMVPYSVSNGELDVKVYKYLSIAQKLAITRAFTEQDIIINVDLYDISVDGRFIEVDWLTITNITELRSFFDRFT
ncbi:hypothetical protein HNP86_001851 [Methanococcus maripaludis]|uniref:Uncharacterized protein n=1 Tax=Methanococcus maripaludis TaxID=39152 RepID=A0A7J9NVI4_METMI|nr:hypothetical protein [Methanococcus maripaludis]MBA2851692.1 hypothetical protein [Methanococcus maripaludis]